jgi:hypothetical protein
MRSSTPSHCSVVERDEPQGTGVTENSPLPANASHAAVDPELLTHT